MNMIQTQNFNLKIKHFGTNLSMFDFKHVHQCQHYNDTNACSVYDNQIQMQCHSRHNDDGEYDLKNH